MSSSYSSFTENAESKVDMRTFDVVGTSEAVEISPKLLCGGDYSAKPNFHTNNISHANNFDDSKGLEGHDDNISCICGADESNRLSSSVIRNKGESCSHVYAELAGRAGDQLGCDVEKHSSYSSDEVENSKVSFSGGNRKEILTVCQKEDLGANSDGCNPLEEPTKSLEADNVGNFPDKADAHEAFLQSHHVDDSDESDLVEHDVKVCDICGDAGRDDLLAICSRCIDGAEHTYCMREMLDKVPEGDWLCEECKLEEGNKKANRVVAEKDQSSWQTDTLTATLSIKPKWEGSDVERTRSSRDRSVAKVSGKRHAEESEVSSAVKKQALETFTGSPWISSPSRLCAHSFDSSIKHVDCGKAKPSHQSHLSSDTLEAARPPPTGPRLQSLRGSFFKSNSFNFPNTRPKTKLVDEVVFQKQKSMKESTSRDTKEVARGTGKFMSFRSWKGSGDSKVKMSSPRFSHVEDIRIPESKSERNYERKNTLKSPRAVGNLTTSSATASTPKVDKKLVSYGELIPFSSSRNHETKLLKGDSKLFSGLRSNDRATSIGSEVPASMGEVKRQLTSSLSGFEQKKPRSAMKDDNSLSLTSSKESTSLAEGINAGSPSHLRPSIIPGTPGSFGLDTSAVRSPKEVTNRDNMLKAAIEAAMLKKPGVYRKKQISDQSHESSSVSCMNNGIGSQNCLPNSSNLGNLTSSEMVAADWQGKTPQINSPNYGKQLNGKKFEQSKMLPVEGTTSRMPVSSLVVSSDTTHSTPEPSKIPAIPDHEYIWQGSFEVNRNGKSTQIWDGIQAHLSTCASPRVFEAVNKLPHKIHLNEVSRSSDWPVQFEDSGVKEDNVALYFFAKDIESYERSYQILLEDMMSGDLALIGSFNGVELLIFPSNQLPEESHRWNMLFFLWGVFRGKKKNSSHQVPGSPEKSCIPRVISSISTDKALLPENICLSEYIDKKLFTCDTANDVVPQAPALIGSHVSSIRSTNGDCDAKGFSLFQEDGQVHSEHMNGLKSQQEPTFHSMSTPLNRVCRVGQDMTSLRDVIEYSATGMSKNIKGEQEADDSAKEDDPKKRPYNSLISTSQINMWHDVNSQVLDEEGTNLVNKNGERYFFPCQAKEAVVLGDLIGGGSSSLLSEKGRSPNLELALGGESEKTIINKEDKLQKLQEETKKEDGDVSASLSLSLSVSSAAVPRTGQSTSLALLFGDIPDIK